MKETDRRKYYRIIVDCWRLFLKYRNPVSADQFWQNLMDDARRIYERYSNSEFCKKNTAGNRGRN